LGMQVIAIRSVRPRQQLPSAQLGLTPTSHAISNERALVFSCGAANLHNQLFMRIVAGRSVDEHNADPMPLQFLQDDHLVHVVACQTVGSRNQDHIEGGPRGLVAQGVEAWPLELGSGVTVISENMLLLDNPIRALRYV